MNIQELEFLSREKPPITIIIFNNNSLGMIRHFQEMYFDSNFYQTLNSHGYSTPDFKKIAMAYGINYKKIEAVEDINEELLKKEPFIVEVILEGYTYVQPKLEYGKLNNDQTPLIDRKLYKYLEKL